MKNLSTGAQNYLAEGGSLQRLAHNARGFMFAGAQPTSADNAVATTKLVPLTAAGAAYVSEVLAEWKLTLSGTTSGAVNGIVIGALVRADTAQAGAATTITLDAAASATNDFYKGMYVITTGGTGPGQIRQITGYVGATKVATVAAWGTNPDVTTTFNLVAGTLVTSAAVPYVTDFTTTATNLTTNVNATMCTPDFTARSSGADVYVTAPKGSGATLNGLRLYAAITDMTGTIVAGCSTYGVDGSGGIKWPSPAVSGVIAKEAATFQGNAIAAGTIGFLRICFDPADDGTTLSTTYKRMDLDCGVSTGSIQLASLAVVATGGGTPVVISTLPLSVSASEA